MTGDAAPPQPAPSPLRVAVIPVTAFAQNCSIVWSTATGEGAVIDPGGDIETILAAIARAGAAIVKILVTHGHLDHASAARELAERLDVPIEGPHEDDRFLLEALPTQGARFGFPPGRSFTPDRWLKDGDEVTVGDLVFRVRHCPGHTPGHVVFVHEGARLAFVGDVLFKGSIGRTDLPRGDHGMLIRAITTRLWPLGSDITFVPGHGPASTFGEERRSNPYVADRVLAR